MSPKTLACAAVLLSAATAFAGRPDGGRFPQLVLSWESIQAAKGHIERAEIAHARSGTLGGHGKLAVDAVNAAQFEIDEAVGFATNHRTPGPGGVVTPKPPLTAHPDDAKYPNLGDARLQIEWAIRHVEDAMQYHAPIGTLGGHGEKAMEALRRALGEINQAERWSDNHH
jgi:hypothetical protein